MNATDNQIIISANGQELTATLAQNSSAEALRELLQEGPLTISMRDYGSMEKVGDIGTSLPTNDEQITTEAGDLILYMGSAFVIYYAPNSWNFTRLGKIDNITAKELKDFLGNGKCRDHNIVPDCILANRCGYDLVVSFPRAIRYKETYRSPYVGIQNDEPL